MGHKPFLVLSDHFTRRGIAVLRYDDRGVGESQGDFATATSPDFATDALAGVRYLASRPEVDGALVGIAGHSEGGLIAPIAATDSPDVGFIVLMAGPGTTGEQILYAQIELIARAGGSSDEEIKKSLSDQEKIFALLKDGEADTKERVAQELRSQLDSLTEEERKAAGVPEGESLDAVIEQQTTQITSPWFRYFLTYDPVPTLERVKQPVLAITGAKDLQVPSEVNLEAIRQALERGGNKNFEVVEMPGLNHLFQEADTGSPSEYAQIEQTFSPDAMEKIADWVLKVTKVAALQAVVEGPARL